MKNAESQASRSIEAFLSDLSSRAATPGGGSASALVGAVAAALAGMVGRLNDKKDGAPGPLHDSIVPADTLRARLLGLMDEDIAAFNELAATWKLPDDPAHQARKAAAVIAATEKPLEIMERCVEVMRLAAAGLEKSKKNCLSDAGVAGLCAHAAVESARLNVMINLPGIREGARHSELRRRADQVRSNAAELRIEIERLLEENYR
ncbi:MAG TPA: cyclodeaminase/cyclohydrolase family protein [Phycisphaerae bacterium]|nr:cyclodeaminase/cyclohydrolase family protein [Phycisphaerae bacterium]